MEGRSLSQSCLQVIKGRWIGVVVAFYVLSCAGATYIFGIYSGTIKESLHYDQQTIDTLSFFKDLGANVGIIAGLLNEFTPSWFILAVGACMNMSGYLMIWLAVTHRIARPPVWQIYLYMLIGANSQTFANTGVLVVCVKNFPYSRGVVLGLLKGFVGLSGAIFTQIYHALYGQDTGGVILLIGWLPSLVSLSFMFFVRPMRPKLDKNESKHFYSFLYLALVLAGFLMVTIIVQNLVNLSSTTFKVMGAITVLLVAANLWIGVRAELEKLPQQQDQSNARLQQLSSSISPPEVGNNRKDALFPSDEEKSKTLATTASVSPLSAPTKPATSSETTNGALKHSARTSGDAKESADSEERKPSPSQAHVDTTTNYPSINQKNANVKHNLLALNPMQVAKKCTASKRLKAFYANWPNRGDDFTIPQALLSFDLWILFFATTCGVGATLTAIDNMGQIGQAQRYSPISVSTCVSLISIWNFLGRVIAGFSSEMLLKRYRFPRTLMLTIIMSSACAGHILIAFPTQGSLYIASIIIGLCFGAQWPILFAVISELFGLKYYATLYNLGAVASPLGSYLLNVKVAGYLYDKEARRQLRELLSYTAPSPNSSPANIASSDLTCMGSRCFRETFIIMTAVSLLGSLISLILVFRTKKFYSEDIYARFRKLDDEETVEGTRSIGLKSG